LLTIGVAFILLVIGIPSLVSGTSWFARVLFLLSTQTHFQNLGKGVIDLRDVVYYLSLCSIGLLLTITVLRKQRFGIQRTTQVALVIGSVILLNGILMPVTLRADLTQTKQYTLADVSKQTVKDLTQPVTLKLFFTSKVPQDLLALRQDVTDILNEYHQANSNQVIVDIQEPNETDTQSYGIPQIQFNIMGSEKFEVSTGYTGLAIVYGDSYETIPVISDTTTLEYDITAAMQKLTRDKTPELAWVNDHGEVSAKNLQSYLRKQYTVTPTKAADLATTSATTAVLVGPTTAFTDQERYIVDQYIMKGNKVLLLLPGETVDMQYLSASANATDLDKLLEEYGVTVNQDLVADFGSSQTLPFGSNGYTVYQSYPLWPVITADGFNKDSAVTATLQSTTLAWPSSLSVHVANGVTATTLLQTTKQAYSYTGSISVNPNDLTTPNKADLNQKTIGVWLSGHLNSAYPADKLPDGMDASKYVSQTDAGQIIIIADADFVSDNFLQQSLDNATVVVNSIDALSQDTGLMTIRSRAALDRPLKSMTDGEKVVTKYTNIFSGIVIVVLLAGASFYWRRRRDRFAKHLYA
jgi:gliding-associated putative ABC transporter substrate-binding component GldG